VKSSKQKKSNKNQCILVTGGAGFIGTNLIIELQEKGYTNIISIDNYSTGSNKNHQSGALYIEWDVRDCTKYLNEFKPSVIFHLAAMARIQPSFDFPVETIGVNIIGTKVLLEWVREHDTQIIYASSSSVHGGVYKNPYTFSKWIGEEFCKLYANVYKIPIIVTRFYNVYGEYMIDAHSPYATALAIFDNQRKEGKHLTVTGDGEQRRDFTHVLDICDGLIRCIGHTELVGVFFEFRRGTSYSMNEIVAMYKDSVVKYLPGLEGEAVNAATVDWRGLELMEECIGFRATRNVFDWIKEK